jgi:uncharacterized phage-associated protein
MVSNNILRRAFNGNCDVTPMKLQKLLYFTYKKYLEIADESLFPDMFEVWKYGPVVQPVYHAFKDYKSNHIRDYHRDKNGNAWIIDERLCENFKQALNYVWGEYSYYDGIALSKLTHMEGTAWHEAFKRDDMYLDDEDIRKEAWVK